MGTDPRSLPPHWRALAGYDVPTRPQRAKRGTGRVARAKAAFVLSRWKPDGAGGGSCFIPLRTFSEMNRRDHWRTVYQRKLQQHETVSLVMGRARVQTPCCVRMVRIIQRGKALDSDNLASALKFVVDQIAKIIGVDDGDTSRVTWERDQEAGKMAGVHVMIKRRPPGDAPTPPDDHSNNGAQ